MSKKSNNFLGKEEVGSSNLLAGSIVSRHTKYLSLYFFLQAHLWRTDFLFYNFYSFFALITSVHCSGSSSRLALALLYSTLPNKILCIVYLPALYTRNI